VKWPQIPRPWNPAYQEVYDTMTEEERQNSFKIDMTLLIVVLFVCAIVGGCSRVEGTGTPPTTGEVSKGTSPSSRDMDDYYEREERAASQDAGHWVTIDRATGCHYLGSTAYAITPRMSRIENGRQYQVGCYVEDVAPVQTSAQ